MLAAATVLSTLSGGLFGLRFERFVRLILGLTAGVVLGVVAFDLLPELFELTDRTGMPIRTVMSAMIVAFLLFHVLEKEMAWRKSVGKAAYGALNTYKPIVAVGAEHPLEDELLMADHFRKFTTASQQERAHTDRCYPRWY